MTFIEAVEAACAGAKVKRASSPRILIMGVKNKRLPRLLCNDEGNAWLVFHDDVLADDWEVIP